jgi:hypothetical protein
LAVGGANGERSIIKRQCLDKKSLILLKSEDFLFLGGFDFIYRLINNPCRIEAAWPL